MFLCTKYSVFVTTLLFMKIYPDMKKVKTRSALCSLHKSLSIHNLKPQASKRKKREIDA